MVKKESSSTPNFTFLKPDKVEHGGDLEDYFNWWMAKQEQGVDIRHYIAHARHEGYLEVYFPPNFILKENEIPKDVFGLERHFASDDNGYLEVSYYN